MMMNRTGTIGETMTQPDSQGFGQTLDLLQQAKGGDEGALGSLLHRYTDRVLEIVRIRLGRGLRESIESRDILQETLFEAFRGFDRFEMREDAHFVNWISKIAERRILRRAEYQHAEKRDAARAVPLDAPSPADTEGYDVEPPSGGPGAATRMVQAEERDAVADCVAALPDNYRAVIAMRDYVGADWDEVARETGHSTANAARMAHNRARVALGKLLRQRGLVGER